MSALKTILSVLASPRVKSPSAVIAPVACKLPVIKTSLSILILSIGVAPRRYKSPITLLIILFSTYTSPTSAVVPNICVLLVVPLTSNV